MDEHLDSGISLAEVARAAGMSNFHFCRRFKASTGLRFWEYLARRRIAKAKELLRDTSRTVTDVFREMGFKNMTHFGRVFKKLEGKLPSEFRREREDGNRRVTSQVGGEKASSN
jgi:transcriptional regulator GlxA family with amidase domain